MQNPKRPLLLIVDDDPTNLRLLCEALGGPAFSIAVATDGEMALDHACKTAPDLVLLDGLLPGLNGFEVCKRLKQIPETSTIPVIFMTALSDIQSRMRAFEVGAVDYVIKPFELEEVKARVTMQITLRSTARALSTRNLELQRAQEEVERARAVLEFEVLQRTEELREAKARLEAELFSRLRADEERTHLQEQIIAAQAERLAEMSTPIIPITERILVMPLIGVMDEARVARVLSAALEKATQTGADVMILDITGVPRADIAVAEAIITTARALRLIGTRTVLTGIRPDVARTLVELSVDFTEIITQSTLQGGIAYVMRGRAGR